MATTTLVPRVELTEYLKNSEANIVACLYSDPQLFNTHDALEEKMVDNLWKVYYVIGRDMVNVEDKLSLDEMSIGFYLEKHAKLKEKYIEYGGFDIIKTLSKITNRENLDGYIEEHQKYKALVALLDNWILIPPDKLSQYKDMKAEDIYGLYETIINNIFVNVESKIQSYNLLEGLETIVSNADEGNEVGLPINSFLLNDTIGGNSVGNITLLGANSGIGKTTLTIIWLLESIIKHDEKLVVMINEQDEVKWKQEIITYYANNKFGGRFEKKRWREGKFTTEEKVWLAKAVEYLALLQERKNITIIPLQRYKTSTVIKLMRKYKGMGVNYFVLDTFKADADSENEVRWQQMSDAMVRLYDTAKPAGKNIHLWVTLQLSKASVSRRFLSQESIGQAKNVVDVASTSLYVRRVFQDEKEDGIKELKVYRLEGLNLRTKIPVKLNKDKDYFVIFVDKNRFGASMQIVAEYDFGLNTYKEVGMTRVPEDF